MALLSLPGAWDTGIQPPLLLLVHERLNPANRVAYDRIESEIRRVCVRWGCPNAYIALTSAAHEVWWLTAWSSQEELDRAGALYAENPALMSRLAPLNARKRALTDEPTTTLAKAAGEAPLAFVGARFLTLTPAGQSPRGGGALYELPDGRRVALASSSTRPPRRTPDSVLLAIHPEWSLPPEALVRADPGFWGARRR
jgi:hypothetical protein